MRDALKRRLTFANVASALALFVALGGTVYAATAINGAEIRRESIPANRLEDNSLTGTQVRERSLSAVPSAVRATQATNAVNSSTLGGQLPSAFDPAARWAEVDATGPTGGASIVAQSGGITLAADAGADTYLDFGTSLLDSHVLVSPGGLTDTGGSATPLTTGICGGAATAGPAGVTCAPDVSDVTNILKVEGPQNVLYYVVVAPNPTG